MTHVDAGGRCRESENIPRLDSIHHFGNSLGGNDIARMTVEPSLHLADLAEYILIR
jgi:hypothetical protein